MNKTRMAVESIALFVVTFALLMAGALADEPSDGPRKRQVAARGARRVTGSDYHAAYQQLMIRHLLTKKEPINLGESAINAVMTSWQDDAGYRTLHHELGTLQITSAVGLERSGESGKGLEAFWFCKSKDGSTRFLALRNGTCITSDAESNERFRRATTIAHRMCPESRVAAFGNILHGTVHSIVTFDGAAERVLLCNDIPDELNDSWTDLFKEFLAEHKACARRLLNED